MTIIMVLKTKSGLITGFMVFGHSCYADKGNDIVCASISTCTTILTLYGENNGLIENHNEDANVPEYCIKYRICDCETGSHCAIMAAIEEVFKSLAFTYNKYVSVFTAIDDRCLERSLNGNNT